MLKSIFSIAFLSCSIAVISQTKNINFEHSTFAEIKAKAKKKTNLFLWTLSQHGADPASKWLKMYLQMML